MCRSRGHAGVTGAKVGPGRPPRCRVLVTAAAVGAAAAVKESLSPLFVCVFRGVCVPTAPSGKTTTAFLNHVLALSPRPLEVRADAASVCVVRVNHAAIVFALCCCH